MKKWLLGVMAAVMAVSLAACTPTPDKQKEETAGLQQRRKVWSLRVRAALPTRCRIPMLLQ